MTSPSPIDWSGFRRRMPVTEKWAYFDHAAVSPLPAPTRQALVRWADQAAAEGDVVWPEWAAQVEQVRSDFAEFINADAQEIAFVSNTTSGVNLIAEGIPWKEGDNLVTLENEFPTNLYPWMNLASRGVETRRAPVDGGVVSLQRIADLCDERTRLISVSWVGYASGWRIDVEAMAALAHDHGALLFLDAIQGLGVYPLNVKATGVDFLAADGHKWLLGPEGAGVLYVRREHLDRLRPMGLGWNSVRRPYDFDKIDFDLRDTAARYEGGSWNTAGILALGESLRLLTRFGAGSDQSSVAARVLEVADSACRELEDVGAAIVTPRNGEHRSGIVGFQIPGADLKAIRRKLLDSGVALSQRGEMLRISPHAYNNDDDIQRLTDILAEFV